MAFIGRIFVLALLLTLSNSSTAFLWPKYDARCKGVHPEFDLLSPLRKKADEFTQNTKWYFQISNSPEVVNSPRQLILRCSSWFILAWIKLCICWKSPSLAYFKSFSSGPVLSIFNSSPTVLVYNLMTVADISVGYSLSDTNLFHFILISQLPKLNNSLWPCQCLL